MSGRSDIYTNTDIYKYTANLTYILDGKVHEIETTSIRTIAIDCNYDQMNMPMIFMTLGIYQSLANTMILHQDTGLFILDIKRCVSNSDMPDLYSDYIYDKFIYFIAGNIDSENTVELEEDALDDDTTVTIGLLSLDHVNKNKKTVNGIINGKLSSAMYYLTGHLPIVIEPPTTNVTLENVILPPVNSVNKSLEYLNSINVFYNTPYRFFIDFDQAYLISSSGRAVKAKGENISSVMITIRHEDEAESMIQGMTTNRSQALYEIIASSKDCEISDNALSEKSYSKISATNTSGSSTKTTLSTVSSGSSITPKTKTIRISNDNAGLLNNLATSIDQSAVQILVQKTDIDSSVLTMNKEYIIRADEASYNGNTYNGRYLLTRKRELYIRDDTTFTMDVMLLFKKVPNG